MRSGVKVLVLALCVFGLVGVASAQDEPIEVFNQESSDDSGPITLNEPDTTTNAEARKLVDQASRELMVNGDPDKAIALCQRAIRGKAYRCYGHMGVAYKMKGDKANACASFKKHQSHGNANAKELAKAQMSELGCP